MPRPKPAVPTLTIVLTPVRPAPIQLMQPGQSRQCRRRSDRHRQAPEYALQHFRSVETVVPGDRHVLLEGEVVVFALPLRHVVNHVRCTPRDRPADSRPIVAGIVSRMVFGVLARTRHDIRVIVHTIVIEIDRTGDSRILAVRLAL